VFKQFLQDFSGVIIDVGCGNRSMIVDAGLSLNQSKIVGIDIATPSEILDYTVKAEATKLPIKSHSVNCIFLGEIIEHLNNQESMMQEICRVIADNGLMVISTPNISQAYGDHKKMLNYRSLKRLVTSFGFTVLKERGIYCKYLSRTGLYRRLGSPSLKRFLMELHFPTKISFDIILLCQKRE
jgi:ubiquinone/menaquinone biosynthesis C-methylase UbiE